jgi:hypothetical protein
LSDFLFKNTSAIVTASPNLPKVVLHGYEDKA